MKPGFKTTEFYSQFSPILAAIIMLLVGRGVIPEGEAELWNTIIIGSLPIAQGLASSFYAYSRAKVKAAE